MRFFIDCEYNGSGGELLSMALVPIYELIDPFYEEVETDQPLDPWVAEHVAPLFNKTKVTKEEFQKRLEQYLSQFTNIELIADWPEDIALFTRWLITGPGERIDTPPLTIEIRRDLDAVSEVPHHALADAKAMRLVYIERHVTPG